MKERSVKTYSLIISDDPIFTRRLRQVFQTNEISKDWRTLVFSNKNELKDLTISKLFPFIIKSQDEKIVITLDFENNFDFQLDLLKIINKYKLNDKFLKIGIFGEENTKQQLKTAFQEGCHIVDYKRTDIDDIINTIMLLKNEEHDHLPKYANAPGNGECLWPSFLGMIKAISHSQVFANMKFAKVSPDEEWIKKFVPDLSERGVMITNDASLDKKFRWLEDTNKLRYDYEDKDLIGSKYLISKTVEEYSHSFDKYYSYDELEEQNNRFNTILNEANDKRIRVMVIDKHIKLMQLLEGGDENTNIFSYPYLLQSGSNAIEIKPQIIAIQWSGLAMQDQKGRFYEPKGEEKIELLKLYIERNLSADTFIIFFGCGDDKIPHLAPKQLNVPFPMEREFFEKILSIYVQKGQAQAYRVEKDILSKNDLVITSKLTKIGIEIPIVIDEFNEYCITFSSPSELEDLCLIEVNYPIKYYVVVLNKFKDKNQYVGIIMGVNEYEKSILRQEVNRLLRIPIETEDTKEKSEYFRMNNKVLMKRERERIKKERDIIETLKKEPESSAF